MSLLQVPVPVLRTIVTNLENVKLPSKHCGTTGESTRGSGETARRPPSVKAALSVSFGQRAPHRASTRDSSPVRRTITPLYDRDADSRRSPNHHQSHSRDLSDREYSDRDRDRDKKTESGKETGIRIDPVIMTGTMRELGTGIETGTESRKETEIEIGGMDTIEGSRDGYRRDYDKKRT